MKILFTICIVMLCLNVFSQEKIKLPLTKDSVIEFQEVVTLDTTYNYQLLYKATKTWFVDNFKSSKAVIQSEDQTNGRFLAKAFVTVHQTGFTVVDDPDIYFTIQIDVKNGKYRYRLYNFYVPGYYLNTPIETALSPAYIAFIEDKIKKPAFMSMEKYNKKLNSQYIDFYVQVSTLVRNLKATMTNSKSDIF